MATSRCLTREMSIYMSKLHPSEEVNLHTQVGMLLYPPLLIFKMQCMCICKKRVEDCSAVP